MDNISISDLKAKAKDQLLGNYGTAAGSFALYFVIIYTFAMIMTTALNLSLSGSMSAAGSRSVWTDITRQLVTIVIAALTSVLTTGYTRIIRKISDGDAPSASDLFYVITHHPDKVIIISLFMSVPQAVLAIPSIIVSYHIQDTEDTLTGLNGKMFLGYVVLSLLVFILSTIIDMYLYMAFQIYLDDPEGDVMNMIKGSIGMMRGNILKFFYMQLSFIGYWLLIVLSLGVSALWIFPYQLMTMTEFYKQLRGEQMYARVEEI